MMFWLYTAAVAALIVVVPFIRFFLKRIILLFKLKSYCRRNRSKLHKTRMLWFLGNRKRKACDFFIETASEIYAIKLFGMFRKNTKLIIKENGEYIIRRYYAFLSSKSQALLFSDSKPKPFNDYTFEIDKSKINNGKAKRNILLVHPQYLEIQRIPQYGKYQIIDSGDILYQMEIYSLAKRK